MSDDFLVTPTGPHLASLGFSTGHHPTLARTLRSEAAYEAVWNGTLERQGLAPGLSHAGLGGQNLMAQAEARSEPLGLPRKAFRGHGQPRGFGSMVYGQREGDYARSIERGRQRALRSAREKKIQLD